MEPSLHFSIPFFIFSFLGFSLPYCFLLSFLALLPDFDVFFKVHRSETHSFLVYLPILFLALLLYSFNAQLSLLLLAVYFSFTSHVLLDTLGGYTLALWPIVGDELSISVNFNIKFGSSFSLIPKISLIRKKHVRSYFKEFEVRFATGEGLLISFTLLLVSLVKLFKLGW
ncbi:MAG: metal-dependent hydrolase [Thermoproteota archaeon]